LVHALIAALACALGVGLGVLVGTRLGVAPGTSIALLLPGVAFATIAILYAQKAINRVPLAPARNEPTLEQLSTELVSITSPDEVARAIERSISRWLPCDDVELSIAGSEGSEPACGDFQERSGTRARAEIEVPVMFEGRRLATLFLGATRDGTPLTRHQLDLVGTIGNHGALALAHAIAYQELEEQRRQQAAAWRGEREALVQTVAAEISHDIRQPLNFFRIVFDQASRGQQLDPEDVDLARDEVERLERLVAGLKRMAGHRLERKLVRVNMLCDRVELLLRDNLSGRAIEREVETDAVILGDIDKLTRVLVNLVVNALQAAGESGRVGIVFRRTATGQELAVWDDGPGFSEPGRLFAPWYTTKPRGTGLGLAIAHRLVRAHGWNIGASRREGRTVFAITIVSRDAVENDGREAADVA
jgi:signal transduction histidine kinase